MFGQMFLVKWTQIKIKDKKIKNVEKYIHETRAFYYSQGYIQNINNERIYK